METHATIAAWDGDQRHALGLDAVSCTACADVAKIVRASRHENVRVISHFIGGAFG